MNRAASAPGRRAEQVPFERHGAMHPEGPRNAMRSLRLPPMLAALALLAACQPTVKVEAPDKPIVINLNVKIEQEVRIKIERDVEDLLKSQPELF